MPRMRTAVILSTYNSPERLEPTLVGYAAQLYRDFELIIADDGSTEATRHLIESMASRFAMPLKHVWQPDLGFRKCRILNQAALSTKADYLIFSDGDCIPRKDFVAAHVARAKPGRFLSGGYFKLPAQTCQRLTADIILTGRVTDPAWLVENGVQRSPKLAKLSLNGWRARAMNFITPTRPTWNGHNASGWRSDLLRVNGFDERMAYWAQDREFGERLENAGVSGRQIRYSAVCVHVHHERPYNTEASREKNKKIRAETRRNRARWTAHGIVKSSAPLDVRPSLAPAHDVAIREFLPA